MKNLILILILFVCISSCKKDESTPTNNLLHTKWTATDDIAQLVYGGTCTTSVEFLTETTCQDIDVRVGGIFGSSTKVTQRTYTLSGNTVIWNGITGTISGSVMTTNMNTVSGGKRVYSKE